MQSSPVVFRSLVVPISDLPPALAGMQIAHISDFHFRRWNRVAQAALDLLKTLDFDLLVATGDFGTNPRQWRRPAALIRRFFGPLVGRAPIYGVFGNHDCPRLADAPDMPLTFLRNQSVSIQRDGSSLELAGIDQSSRGSEDLQAALAAPGPHPLTILLAHYPSTFFRLPPGRVDLQFSGHTHGGQIRLPYLGCLWANDRLATRLARGLHSADGAFLHVNPGIGVSMLIPVRINCPPEVTLLTLEPTPIERHHRSKENISQPQRTFGKARV